MVIIFLAFASTASARDVSIVAIKSAISIHQLHWGTGRTLHCVPSRGGTCSLGRGTVMLGAMGLMTGMFPGWRNGGLVKGWSRCDRSGGGWSSGGSGGRRTTGWNRQGHGCILKYVGLGGAISIDLQEPATSLLTGNMSGNHQMYISCKLVIYFLVFA